VPRPVYHHCLVELVRAVPEDLLSIVTPLEAGEDVKVDGFRWLMDNDNPYQIFPETDSRSRPSKTAFYEHGIDLIKKLTEYLLTLIEFEQDGQAIKVDGFRLKNFQDWQVSNCYPGNSCFVCPYRGTKVNDQKRAVRNI